MVTHSVRSVVIGVLALSSLVFGLPITGDSQSVKNDKLPAKTGTVAYGGLESYRSRFIDNDLKSARFIKEDLFTRLVTEEQQIARGEVEVGTSSQEAGSAGNQNIECSFAPVNTARASFTPVRFCDAAPLRLTDVSENRKIAGFYVRNSDGRHYSFRLHANTNGGYSGVTIMSNGAFDSTGGTMAMGISGDGNVLVGAGFDSGGPKPIRWGSVSSAPHLLSRVPCESGTNCTLPTMGSSDWGEAVATDFTGRTLVGSYSITGAPQHFRARRWTVDVATGSMVSSQQIPTPDYAPGVPCAGSSPPSGSYSGYGNCMSYGHGVNRYGTTMAGFFRHLMGGGAPVGRPSRPYVWYQERSDSTVLQRLHEPTVFSWQPGSSAGGLVSGAVTQISTDLALRPRGKAFNIAPDGWAVVGSDSTGSVARVSNSEGDLIPLLATGPLPTDTEIKVDPDGAGPSGVVLVGRATEDGFRWRPGAYRGTSGVMTPMDDVPDEFTENIVENFSRSVYQDSSNGGCRTVGRGYAGGAEEFPLVEFLESAVIRPGIDCQSAECRKSQLLKTEVGRIMANGRGIDKNNPSGAYWQLTDATAISPDGKIIVGSALCHIAGQQTLELDAQVGFIIEIKH